MEPPSRILPRRPVYGSRPGRSPGSRIVLLPAPSRSHRPVALAGFVPDHSDGVAAAFYRLPWALVGIPGASNAGNRNRTTARPQDGGGARHRNLTLGRSGGETGQPR